MYFSIVIPCKNEGSNVKMTVDSILSAKCEAQYEINVVDDASSDGCCSFLKGEEYSKVNLFTTKGLGAARARNFGAEKASGDVVVFCDAHIEVEDKWLDLLQEDFKKGFHAVSPAVAVHGNPTYIGYGQTWNSKLEIVWLPKKSSNTIQVPLLPGGCVAILKRAFNDVEGFDSGYKIWGHEDEEISLKLWLFGYVCGVNPGVIIYHVFRSGHPYDLTLYHVHYNWLRMAYSHFNIDRVEKIKNMIKHTKYYRKVMDEVLNDNTLEQRLKYFNKRKYNDDWFMKKFNIKF